MKYIIANWKMHGRQSFVKQWCNESERLIAAAQNRQSKFQSDRIIVAPPAAYLSELKQHLPSMYAMAAQDVSSFSSDGAHTGEISAAMLKDLGCKYVLVGHSERRAMNDKLLLEKLENTLSAGMIPVYCVGEPLDIRKCGETVSFIHKQLSVLMKVGQDTNLIIAYEPIWAIGTGETASLADIEKIHGFIKDKFNWPVIYGGSVKAENAKHLLSSQSIDGALVGGASLKPEEFLSIVEAASW